MSRADSFEVKDGPVTIPVYAARNGAYIQWTVVYRHEGRLIRKKFNTRELALDHATDRARAIANGRASAHSLTFDQASEYLAAKQILGPKHSLTEAARDYVRRHTFAPKPVAEAVAEFLATKRRAKLNADYLRMMELRLAVFAKQFQCSLAQVTGAQLNAWLDDIGQSLKTRNNYLGDVRNLYAHAKRHKWISREFDELETVELPKAGPGKISPYSPEEMRAILRHAQRHASQWLPCLAIRAFSGIRSEEVGRLRPEHFHSTGWISADCDVTKTSARRLIPILPVLKQWLTRYPLSRCPIQPFTNNHTVSARISELVASAGVPTRVNGFRDSYVSYRMAEVMDAGKVAQETGHSVKMLLSSYREIRMLDGRVITPAEAVKYFAIRPQTVPKNPKVKKPQ